MVPASPFDQAELAPLRVMHLDCYGRARGAHTRIDHLLPGTTAVMRIPSVRAESRVTLPRLSFWPVLRTEAR